MTTKKMNNINDFDLNEIMQSLEQIQQNERIENFRIPGLKQQIISAVFCNKKYIYNLGKYNYNGFKTAGINIIKSISFNCNIITAKLDMGTEQTLHISVPNGFPIKKCTDINDTLCSCGNRQPCVCVAMFLHHSMDRSPTSQELFSSEPWNFDDSDGVIRIGDMVWTKSELPIDGSFSCANMMDDTHKAIQYFTDWRMILLLFAYTNCICSKTVPCSHCGKQLEWSEKNSRFQHWCKLKKVTVKHDPISTSPIFSKYYKNKITNIILFAITFGLDLPFEKQKSLIGIHDAHTMGYHFGIIASVAELFMKKYGRQLEGCMEMDGHCNGAKYKYARGRIPPEEKKWWVFRLMEREYTAKMGHARWSIYGGPESVSNHSDFMKSVMKPNQTLFTDGSSLARSNFAQTFQNVGWTNHSDAEFRREDTKYCNRLQKAHDNGPENSFNEDQQMKRIRKGLGPRCSDPFYRQTWQNFLDWKHTYTDRTATDISKTFVLHVSVLFPPCQKISK